MSVDKKIFIDLRRRKGYTNEIDKLNYSDLTTTIQFKTAATKKMRLRGTRFYQGEYSYSMTREGLIMNYKQYEASKQKQAIS